MSLTNLPIVFLAGLGFLATWSVFFSFFGLRHRRDSKSWKWYFYRMNMYWALINLAIVIVAFLSLNMQLAQIKNLENLHGLVAGLRQTLLFNVWLDCGYVIVGAIVLMLRDPKHAKRFKGYGLAIILQGLFLLLLDSFMFFGSA